MKLGLEGKEESARARGLSLQAGRLVPLAQRPPPPIPGWPAGFKVGHPFRTFCPLSNLCRADTVQGTSKATQSQP